MMKENKKIVYVDMDNVVVDFMSGVEAIRKKMNPDVIKVYEETDTRDLIPHVFGHMKPIEGAIESVEKLAEKYDVYFLSTASWENSTSWSDKLLWIKKHFPQIGYKKLILSHNKGLNKGDYLIDDRTANGAGNFEGELILFGSEKYKDWDCVLEYLMNKK